MAEGVYLYVSTCGARQPRPDKNDMCTQGIMIYDPLIDNCKKNETNIREYGTHLQGNDRHNIILLKVIAIFKLNGQNLSENWTGGQPMRILEVL